MQVNKNNITQFLTSTNMSFMIPVYQRNYDWAEENCKQLWNDIWYVSQSANPQTHFLGTVCSKTANGHEKTIIDGQQRITTITLLMKAMHDHVDNADFKRDIDSNFLHNTTEYQIITKLSFISTVAMTQCITSCSGLMNLRKQIPCFLKRPSLPFTRTTLSSLASLRG